MNRISIKRRNGFTLIEMVISVSLLSMLSIVAFSSIIHMMSGWASGTSKIAAVNYSSIAMQKICNDIRPGKSATANGSTLTVVFPQVIQDASTGDTIYNLSTNETNPHVYSLSGTDLVRQVGTTRTVIAHHITNLEFGAVGGTVTITLTNSQSMGNKTATQVMNERISLRNYRIN